MLKNKAVIISIGIFLFIVVLFGGIILYLNGKSNNQQPEEDVVPQLSIVPTSTLITTEPTLSGSAAKTFEGLNFKIEYPANFSVVTGEIPGMGYSTTFSQTNSGRNILIEDYDSNVKPIEKLSQAFRILNYSTGSAMIDQVAASVYTGARFGLLEMGYIFEKNGRSYKILFTYPTSQKDAVTENIYRSMLASFEGN